MNNYFINITRTLNLKTLNKGQIDVDKFDSRIRIKNTQNCSRNYSRKFSF